MLSYISLLNSGFLFVLVHTNPLGNEQTLPNSVITNYKTDYRDSLPKIPTTSQAQQNTGAFSVPHQRHLISVCSDKTPSIQSFDSKLATRSAISNPCPKYFQDSNNETPLLIQNVPINLKNPPHIVHNYIFIATDNFPNKNNSDLDGSICTAFNQNQCTRVKKNVFNHKNNIIIENTDENNNIKLSKYLKKLFNNINQNNDYQNSPRYYKVKAKRSFDSNSDGTKEEKPKTTTLKRKQKEKTTSGNKQGDISLNTKVKQTKTDDELQSSQYKKNKMKLKPSSNTDYKQNNERGSMSASQDHTNTLVFDDASSLNQDFRISKQNSERVLSKSKGNRHKLLNDEKRGQNKFPSNKKHQKSKTINDNKEKVTNHNVKKSNKNTATKEKNAKEMFAPYSSLQGFDYILRNIPEESRDIYRYIENLLSNYEGKNPNYNSQLNYNNDFYRFSPLSFAWENFDINNHKSRIDKRRKLQKHNKRRLSRKKTKHNIKSEDVKVELSTPKILCNTNESIKDIKDKLSLTDPKLNNDNQNEVSKGNSEMEIIIKPTKVHTISIENHPNLNSHQVLLGVEDTIPIIFDNSYTDDYYPDFTADNGALHLSNVEHAPKKYYGDKYHYVSDKSISPKQVKEANKNEVGLNDKHPLNKHTILFFSDNDEKVDKFEARILENNDYEILEQFQTPPFLENPDFRTRKIDNSSNGKYEPYSDHSIFHDSNVDCDKHRFDVITSIYPCNMPSTYTNKGKALNEISDCTSQKNKKTKLTDVETIHAHSKLAKYGQVLKR